MTNQQIKQLNKKTKDLLNLVNADDIIYIDSNNNIVINGQYASVNEINNLIADAKFFKNSQLFKLFQGTVVKNARMKMFDHSQNFDDMISGKLMLYNLDILRQIVDRLNQLTIKKS